MNRNGWQYKTAALAATYSKVDFGFNARHMKLRCGTDMTFSFDGKLDDGKILAVDGLVQFPDVNKSAIWVKGTGTYEVIAWDAN